MGEEYFEQEERKVERKDFCLRGMSGVGREEGGERKGERALGGAGGACK